MSLVTESNPCEKVDVLGYLGDDVLPPGEALACAVRRWIVDMPPRGLQPAFCPVDDKDDLAARA